MRKAVLLVIFSFIVLINCTPVRVVSSQAKSGADLNAYNSFNFMDVSLKSGQMLDEDNEGVTLLKQAITREMERRGFSQSPDPDLLVNIGIVTQQKVQTRQTNIRDAPRYIGQRRYTWKSEEVVVNRYNLGTATIDIVDARQNEQLWEGVVEGTLSNNPNKLEKRINTGIKNLFEKFPLQPKR